MSITFVRGEGGLGRQPDNEDHVSCLLFSIPSAPPQFDFVIQSVRSITQAESLGITASSLTFGVVHYHLSEFFRLSPNGECYVGFGVMQLPSVQDQATLIKGLTNGRVRQFGAFINDPAQLADYQALLDELQGLHMDAVCILGYEDTINYNTPPDLTTRQAGKCFVLATGDGTGSGSQYAASLGFPYIPAVGAVLGLTSASSVHESFSYVRKYNLSDGSELETPIFSDGTPYVGILQAQLDALHDNGWGFMTKYFGVSGTFMKDNRTSTDQTLDYSSINILRTTQKAERLLYSQLVQELSSPAKVSPTTGFLTLGYSQYVESLASNTLDTMVSNGELSGYSVSVDPQQNILSTSRLVISLTLTPVGVSRTIEVQLNLGINQ